MPPETVSDLLVASAAVAYAGSFAGFVVRAYREEGTLGDTARGLRDVACLVAQKMA